MTDVKKLRKLAEKATPWPKHFAVENTFPTMWLVDENGERHEIMNDDLIFWAAANPQAIIEVLDMVDRYEELLRTNAEFFQTVQGSMGNTICERWATDAAIKEFEIREALEGGKP